MNLVSVDQNEQTNLTFLSPLVNVTVCFCLSDSMATVEYIPRPKTSDGEERAPQKRVTFIPDYTVRVVSDVYYMSLKHTSYRAGRLATVLEQSAQKKASTTLSWQDEIEKVC